MKGFVCRPIGWVEASSEFVIYGLKDDVCVRAHIDDLKHVWRQTLNFNKF